MISISNIDFSPACRVVTPLARAPVDAVMRIVFAVARIAIARQLETRRIFHRMAGLAFQSRVSADQRIFGLPRMIEPPMRPTACVMAGLAARNRAETSLMDRVPVTFFTRCR